MTLTAISTVASDSSSPSALRRLSGLLRIGMGLLLFASIATQVTDQVWNDAFVATEYFGYFTIQSSLMNLVVLLVGGSLAVRSRVDPQLLTAVRMSVLTYAVVTGVVYNALLRNVVSDGFIGVGWPNEVLHVWAPIFIALDWILSPGRPAVAWKRLGYALIYPVLWVVYALVRGTTTGFYTYPFLDPGQPGGYVAVALYVLGIAAFITGLAAAAIAASRVRPRALETGTAT
ncbi:Pr6Pr family membrane protein [Cryobacterium cheniae]|uniref:Pr6Pr family membrane protein n=1 Tax=Cryobacterium cheniae TaxID=1259262 RepID=UPI00141BCA90|nr:Pr6Pr family membrane protein [Cryobacterium cheniae]